MRDTVPAMSASVRTARCADVDRIEQMARRFMLTTEPGRRVAMDAEQLEAFISRVFAIGTIVLGCFGDQVVGMLAIATFAHPMNGQAIAYGCAFWVDPEHRGSALSRKMLGYATDWARQNGCAVLQMAAPTHQFRSFGRFYERQGFAPLETTYQREL